MTSTKLTVIHHRWISQTLLHSLALLQSLHGGNNNSEIAKQVRRLTAIHSGSTGSRYDTANTGLALRVVYAATGSVSAYVEPAATIASDMRGRFLHAVIGDTAFDIIYPIVDEFATADALGGLKVNHRVGS